MCCLDSVFFLLWYTCVFNVGLYVRYVWRAFCMCDCDLCVWLAFGVMSVICYVCTVCGHAWPVCLTVCVVITLRSVVHVNCVQLCARCVWGPRSVMCGLCVGRL